MKIRTAIASGLAILFMLISILLFISQFAPPSITQNIPFFNYVELATSFTQQHLYIEIASATINLYLIPSISLLYGIFFLMTRKGMSFWWMVPYSGVFYYSFYILSQLLSKNRAPQLIMERLNQAPTMALILVILLLLLEVTLFILFSILSGKLYKRAKEKRKGMNTIDKKKKRAKREDKEVKESISKETIEKEVSQEAKPLSFPEIKNVPGLQTIRAKSDTQDEMYVGKLNKLPDETFILTSTPIGMIEDELVEENVSLTSLKRQLKLDESTKGVRVPTSMPSFLNTVKEKEQQRAVEEFSPISTKEETIFPKKESPLPTSQPVKIPENSPIKEEVIVEDDDIDYVSGVGGLVSTVDAPSSLLSRKKINYQYPSADLLDSYPNHTSEVDQDTIDAGENLMETLKEFKIEAKVSAIVKGPTVTMYELTLAPGVRISSISNLADNIAMELAAISVRIVAPIPGKQAVGIEVPNAKRSIIGFKDLLSSVASHSFHLPMILGRKITGEPVVMDLTRTPHLLIAGATGSGKSVCVNSLISSLLYFKSPKEVRLILVDPKIVELRIYNGIPHLLTPVITEPKKTIKALEFCLFEMERRYKLLNSLAVRNIGAYNTKIAHSNIAREKLPYIVVVIDEFADIMTTVGKELETLLARLAAMARAVGIHLVLATQRPSADIITGIIKSNIPTRIAFSVSGQVNSRIIIDEGGAEKLLGGGDMLFVPSWEPSSTRIQGAFLSDDEVERVVNYVKSQGEPDYLDEAFFEDENENGRNGDDDEFDEGSDEAMREKAIKIIIERNGASASYLQRRLRIGYNKAARLIEELEDEGIVGPSRGSKPRELLRMPD